MANDKKPASADKNDVVDKRPTVKKPDAPIKGVRLVTMPTATGSTPALIYRGDVPKVGTKQRYQFDNGIVYSGIVADATSADGEVLVEFRSGLTPETRTT